MIALRLKDTSESDPRSYEVTLSSYKVVPVSIGLRVQATTVLLKRLLF